MVGSSHGALIAEPSLNSRVGAYRIAWDAQKTIHDAPAADGEASRVLFRATSDLVANALKVKPTGLGDVAVHVGLISSWIGTVRDGLEMDDFGRRLIEGAEEAAMNAVVLLAETVADLGLHGETREVFDAAYAEAKNCGGSFVAPPVVTAGDRVYDPRTFEAARQRYEAAYRAEIAYDEAVKTASPEHEAESERLADIRSDAEDAVMAIPSPDASAFAFKYLIAKGDKRGTDCWDEMLEDEAKRFASPSPAVADRHLEWMATRDALLSRYNSSCCTEDFDCPGLTAARQFEANIFETPAAGLHGILAKALLVVGNTAKDGDDAEAVQVFNEAKAMGLIEWMA